MKKKLLLLAVILNVILTNVVAQSFTYNYHGVAFRCKVSNGSVIIKAFNTEAAKVLIPATVTHPKTGKQYEVSTVDLFAEFGNYKTNTVALEKGIANIGDYCFYYFKNLQQCYIPQTVEKVGKKAFNPKHLPSFTMPSSISEEDLRKGLAIYPHTSPIIDNSMADFDINDYIDNSDSDISVQEEVAVKKEVVEITPGTSDIDMNIPTTNRKSENTFCIIIANEKYSQKDTPKVKYAAQDGETFYKYCTKTLGLPREHIKIAKNAKYLEMKSVIDWMTKVSSLYDNNEVNFIFYYAGHGVSDDKGNCKLMPVDVSINDVDNGYGLKDIYNTLGNLTTSSALMIIDACFSGNDRNDVWALNEEKRGMRRVVNKEAVKGNVVVMSATGGAETALAYNDKAHGLFSYYLMKKLQETKGNVSYGELFDYVHKEVLRKSTIVMEKTQTPTVTYSDNIAGKWKDIKF